MIAEQPLAEPLSARATASKLGLGNDLLLLGIMAVLAGCGLIYEYLLSHYAGRVLGSLEAAIYTMIGLMIVSMGLGAFAARRIRCPFSGFATLELLIDLGGALAILSSAALIGFTQQLPTLLADTLGLPADLFPHGGVLASLQQLSQYLPYVWGVILGLMIGMEIPLIARVRQSLSDKTLQHNAGTIYGADYIGAGIGASIWVAVMLAMDIQFAASLTASVNLLAGLLFLWRFWANIPKARLLLIGHLLASVLLLVLIQNGSNWQQGFNNLLYKDNVLYSKATRFQQLTFTERLRAAPLPAVYSLYINGRLQFSSSDEHIYHAFLVHPTLSASARQDKVLIIGGGDGLGLRQVLKWQPQEVTLVDLDAQLVELFQNPPQEMPGRLRKALLAMNDDALNDPRVTLLFDDAYNAVDKLLAKDSKFDAIIVDLPDPSHPDLNKLYSDVFYRKLKELLSADGAITVQSTSPYHAPKAFISVGNTLNEAGFKVAQYHHNVPSFGEWGWSIATVMGKGPRARLNEIETLAIEDNWLTPGLIKGALEFPANFYQDKNNIKANKLGSLQLYHYHQQAWSENQGW